MKANRGAVDPNHLLDERMVEVLLGGPGQCDAPERPAIGTMRPDEIAHLDVCTSCSNRLNEMRETILTLQMAAHTPSAEAVERIWQRVRREVTVEPAPYQGELRAGLFDAARGVVRNLVARLAAPPDATLAGVRGPGPGPPSSQVFWTDPFIVSVATVQSGRPSRFRLIGTVIPRPGGDLPAQGSATIIGPNSYGRTDLDATGNFEFDGLERGDFHVDIVLADVKLQLSPISVRHPGDPSAD